jgi:hypothetical protein
MFFTRDLFSIANEVKREIVDNDLRLLTPD